MKPALRAPSGFMTFVFAAAASAHAPAPQTPPPIARTPPSFDRNGVPSLPEGRFAGRLIDDDTSKHGRVLVEGPCEVLIQNQGRVAAFSINGSAFSPSIPLSAPLRASQGSGNYRYVGSGGDRAPSVNVSGNGSVKWAYHPEMNDFSCMINPHG